MSVPSILKMPSTGVQLNEANTALDQSTGDQAVATIFIGRLHADAVLVSGGFAFFRQIHCLGRLGLHAVGEFVHLDACGEFSPAGAFVEMLLVELCEQIQLSALCDCIQMTWTLQIQNGIPTWPKQRALERRWHEAGRPVGLARDRAAAFIEHNDVARQALVLRAQAINAP